MRHIRYILFSLMLVLACAGSARADHYTAMTSPLPPFSINKGLHVVGISVDTLAVLMSLSDHPMETKDVKLMLWSHAFKLAQAGPRTILLNIPKSDQMTPMFKWVGPIYVSQFVVIGRKNSKQVSSLSELDGHKIGTIRDSLPEKALVASGIQKANLASGLTHVIPLKKLDNRMIEYFAHDGAATTYMMKSIGMNPTKYQVLHTYLEVPLYYAFSKDTDDAFIKTLNENLGKMKKPGADGKSRFDKIVGKYLPIGILQ